jgi:lipopolysaccharide export system permease protein
MTIRRRLFAPVIARHLGLEFARVFMLALLAFVAIYVIVDFFDRFDGFLKHEASAGAIIRYFLFKIPVVVSQVTPFAVLAGGLVGLGLLGRHNEFVALRACGVSVWQVALPMLGLGALLSVAVFAWNERVVPDSARRWHTIEDIEIKKRGMATVFTGRDVWFHGGAGFYNIDRISPRKNALYGLTVYQLGPDFRPKRLIVANAALWDGRGWQLEGARTREFGPDGAHETPKAPDGFHLPETFADFRVASVEPEEFSYGMLRRQIDDLRRKGVDVSESWVDLYLKIALPAASAIMMLLAVPLAFKGTRISSLAGGIGLGFALGFGYFVVLAFTRALGQSHALPPTIAAWAANGLFALVGGYLLLGET